MNAPTASQSSYLVVLCQGQRADGQAYWAYLQMPPHKAKAFQQARQSGTLQLEEFGEILEWGLADTVPLEVQQRMEREHRINHDFESELKTLIEKQRQSR